VPEVKERVKKQKNEKFEESEVELHGVIQYHLGIEVEILPNQPSFFIQWAIGVGDANYPSFPM
jgi:hypothetical protein